MNAGSADPARWPAGPGGDHRGGGERGGAGSGLFALLDRHV